MLKETNPAMVRSVDASIFKSVTVMSDLSQIARECAGLDVQKQERNGKKNKERLAEDHHLSILQNVVNRSSRLFSRGFT